MKKIDVAIIGAGTAGLNARSGAKRAGAKAMLFDPGPLGTTCARVGCMPSKLLIAAAEKVHSAHKAAEFGIGIDVDSITIDGEAVMARVQRMRDGFVNHTLEGIVRAEKSGDLQRKRATLSSATHLEVEGETYEAKAIVVATGSRPWIPPPFRNLGDRLLTTDAIFEIKNLPESLLVVGAGVIGIELALAFARLGVRVVVVEMDGRLAGLADPHVRDHAYKVFSQELDLSTRYTFESVKSEGEKIRIHFVDDMGEARDENFDYALMATGRRPNIEGLGLESLGMGTGAELLAKINPETGQLGESSVFFAGDNTNTLTLLHEAAHEGRIAGENAANYPQPARKVERFSALGIVFSDPQIATVGPHYDSLPKDMLVAEIDFAAQSRAKVLGRAEGSMRLYAAQEDGRLLGATIFGPDAEYLGHLVAWCVNSKMTAEQALEQPFYHPTIVEAIQTALRKILKQRSRLKK